MAHVFKKIHYAAYYTRMQGYIFAGDINLFTVEHAGPSLGKWIIKVPNLFHYGFSPLASEYVTGFLSKCTVLKVGPSNILFPIMYACTFLPKYFTGWGSERVKPCTGICLGDTYTHTNTHTAVMTDQGAQSLIQTVKSQLRAPSTWWKMEECLAVNGRQLFVRVDCNLEEWEHVLSVQCFIP